MQFKMSQHSRNKADKNSDVSSARNKLDGVLQTLMDKNDESSDISDEDYMPYEHDLKESSNRLSSKRGLGHKIPRKRKRKEEDNVRELNNGISTYVMKLFDRSVDLAKFNESSPLYPIARTWVYNEPFQDSAKIHFAPPVLDDEPAVEEEDDSNANVYELPVPLKIKTEDGEPTVDLRIPNRESPEIQNFTLESLPQQYTDVLMANHMTRWKQVRQNWKEAALVNETRYKDSLSTIKSLKVVYE